MYELASEVTREFNKIQLEREHEHEQNGDAIEIGMQTSMVVDEIQLKEEDEIEPMPLE